MNKKSRIKENFSMKEHYNRLDRGSESNYKY